MQKICVVDSGWGNMHSIAHALTELGTEPVISSDPDQVYQAEIAILPGVGAFGKAAEALWASGLAEAMRQRAQEGKPLLGICLGMQLMFESSEESEGAHGLGIFEGDVARIRAEGLKVPHMGWNQLEKRGESMVLPKDKMPFVYFVHSYAVRPEDRGIITASAQYGIEIPAIVERGSVCGMQFHPEKSGMDGMRMLERFLKEAKRC